MSISLPRHLMAASRADGRAAWLEALPAQIEYAATTWGLTVGEPYEPGGQTAWVAPAHSRELGDVVLKVAWSHMEAEDEAAGLREWRGEGAVFVHADERLAPDTKALLLERCTPGTTLAGQPEEEPDVVIAGLLRRLWRRPADATTFRPLHVMCDDWADSFERKIARGSAAVDPGLAREGAALFRSLPRDACEEMLLCTDLHAENVLAAQREPWLVIDPKPFVGDPTYDGLQHLLNCEDRLAAEPGRLVTRFADLLGLDADRLLLWLFARCVIESAHWPWAHGIAFQVRP